MGACYYTMGIINNSKYDSAMRLLVKQNALEL